MPETVQLRSWRSFFHTLVSKTSPLRPCGSRIRGSGEDAYSRLSNAAVDLIAQTIGLNEQWSCVDFGCGEGVALLQIHHSYHCARFLGLDKQPHLVARAQALCHHLFPTLNEKVAFHEADVLDECVATSIIEAVLFPEPAPTMLFALVNNVNYGPLLNQAIANILYGVQQKHPLTHVTVVAFQEFGYGRTQHLSAGEQWMRQASKTVFKHREMQKYKYGALEWRVVTWQDRLSNPTLTPRMLLADASDEYSSDSESDGSYMLLRQSRLKEQNFEFLLFVFSIFRRGIQDTSTTPATALQYQNFHQRASRKFVSISDKPACSNRSFGSTGYFLVKIFS